MVQYEAVKILKALRQSGIEAYIVGSVAKDILNNSHVWRKDIDIVVPKIQTLKTIRILKRMKYKEKIDKRINESNCPENWVFSGNRRFFYRDQYGVDLFSWNKIYGITVPNIKKNSQLKVDNSWIAKAELFKSKKSIGKK